VYESERELMVDRLVSAGYLNTPKVIDVMRRVERHRFVPAEVRVNAYDDTPLPIGSKQTISAPHMVSMMTEYLDVHEDSKILEVGAGSGYQAAILAELAPLGFVYTVERVKLLAEKTSVVLQELNYGNIKVITGDGTLGYPQEAPFDRIIVTAAAPKIPKPLVEQLAGGGRLLIPVGGRWYQELIRVDKDEEGGTTEKSYGGCVFVPLIGEEGW
jgi:protein-L-isoaspartate(D-aspartate) O-methyltransferase